MNDTVLNIEKPTDDIERRHEGASKGDTESNTVEIDIESIEEDAFKQNKSEEREQAVIELTHINEERNNNIKNNDKENVQATPPQPNVVWVQYQVGTGRGIPEGGGAPLNYDPRTRNHFVKLVLTLVFAMLCCTAAFNLIVFNSPNLKTMFLRSGFLFAIAAMILMVGLNYAIACSPCTRQVPCNLICLLLAVVGMSVICAFITVRYETRIVLYAVVATGAVVFVCILLACSNFDFTQWLLYVIVISVAFCVIAMIASLSMALTGTYMSTLHLVILIVGTLINVVILTIELQTILGGRAVELSEDDYALGAFLLYTSIVDVFLKMVHIMGIVDNW